MAGQANLVAGGQRVFSAARVGAKPRTILANRTARDLSFIARGRRPCIRSASSRNAEVSTNLLQLLEQGGSTTELSRLVDELSSSGEKFDEGLIGGGPWMVVYQQGAPILWGLGWQLGKVVRGANAASQDLDPATRSVVSKVQYWGDNLYVTASGQYEPEGSAASTPKKVNVIVTSGCLHLFGLDIQLPIRGNGSFEVLYLDSNLRIFRAPTGLVVVQVKWDRLWDRQVGQAA